MKTIRYTNMLFYYDGPQVFEARDGIGGHYIAVALEAEDSRDRYLVSGVAPAQLSQFRSGTLDLKSLLADSVEDEWYLATIAAGLTEPLDLVPQSTSLSESGLLPDDGFLLHDRVAEESALKEARERRNLVLEIATEPPEATTDHRIRVNTLVGLLHYVQVMVRHAYRTATKGRKPQPGQRENHMMNVVVPAAAGSFRVVLEAAQLPDLFGHNDVALGLQKIDMLFENSSDPHETLETLKENRGHLAGVYLKLMRFLVDHRTGLHYSWAEPTSERSNGYAVTEAETKRLVDVLSSVTHLGVENITLEGRFERFNRRSGSWGLLTNEGRVLGKIKKGGPSLDGLQVDGRYRFYCEEEIEEIDVTGRESRKVYLNSHEPL